MRIRIKEKLSLGEKRIDSHSNIDNIEVKKDLSHPDNDLIHIYFKGKHSSGILNLTNDEAQSLASALTSITSLVGKSKKI